MKLKLFKSANERYLKKFDKYRYFKVYREEFKKTIVNLPFSSNVLEVKNDGSLPIGIKIDNDSICNVVINSSNKITVNLLKEGSTQIHISVGNDFSDVFTIFTQIHTIPQLCKFANKKELVIEFLFFYQNGSFPGKKCF